MMHSELCTEQQHLEEQDFHDYGFAEALPGFQAGWSDIILFFSLSFLFVLFAHLGFPCKYFYSSQVKLLITNNAFCIVQRATAQSKIGNFRDCGVAEAPPGFQAGWSDCMYFFSLFLFILFAHLEIMQPRHSSP
jgi:hypothetical protein